MHLHTDAGAPVFICFIACPQLSSTDLRLSELGGQRAALAAATDAAESACTSLRGREDAAKALLSSSLANKYKLLLATSRCGTDKAIACMQAGTRNNIMLALACILQAAKAG